jgi:uncharacterized protein (TIGR03067 family)
MKSIQFLFVLALLVFTAPTPSADGDQAAKNALQQLQGEWTMVSGSADGQPMPTTMLKDMKRICSGNELTVMMSGQVYFKAKLSLDPTKNPKTIDYQMTEGVTKGKRQLGIYEIDGDTFKSSFAKPDQERPTDFKPAEGRTVSIWKRTAK